MFKNYLKIAFRSLIRNKAFSVINITGLAIGMAGAVIILLWIQNELSYDQFHVNKDRIYEAWNRVSFDGKVMTWNATPKVLARTVERDLPEVEQATRVNWPNRWVFSVGDREQFLEGVQVDPNFLKVFSFPLLEGNPESALNNMNSIVLTEKAAVKLFGKEEAVGKTVRILNQGNFTVSGVLKNLPNNTSLDFEYLMQWRKANDDAEWGNNNTHTFVLLKRNASVAAVQAQMKTIKQRYGQDPGFNNWQMFLYPISRWRLYSQFEDGKETGGGRITLVKLFGTIAVFILLIACINFMNLSTAKSEQRAKEVGIRKIVGAQKKLLVVQFLGESILVAFIAGVIAIVIVNLCLPAFNQLTDKTLFIPWDSLDFWLSAVGFILLTGVLAGSYPAFFLSSFRPAKVLKGAFKKANALVTPRKVLVVFQFTIAIILIICTVIVKEQIDYAKDRRTGYEKNSLIYCYLSEDIEKNYSSLKNDLMNSGAALSLTRTSSPLTQDWNGQWGQKWEGKDPNDKTDFSIFVEDGGLGKTAGLRFVAGRDIDIAQYPADSLAVILNESALKVMKFNNPIGQIIEASGLRWHVVGVIKDFILSSPYQPVKPMLIDGPKGGLAVVHIKLNNKNTTSQNIKVVESIFKKYSPEYLFVNNFVDEEYAAKFADEVRTGTLAALFAGLTILISCLGLFGLATYMAEARIKEIGVRKVLGGSAFNISVLLSKDFLKLVIMSTIIASPVAWSAMQKWLQDYNYRITISWMVFAASGLVAILIALLTISYQAIRAANSDPVKCLRAE
ncbi:MAG TPA: ABC transporter permease [Puia sp.]|nr:ABC transporter permease [Puia sp.]